MLLAGIWSMPFANGRINFMVDIDSIGDDPFIKVPSIEVEVAYALPDKQELITLSVKQGTTALAAVLTSGLTTKYPEININEAKMGVFSKPLDGKHLPLPADYQLEHKDRVEIYRPLLIDPKEARLQRAQTKEKAKRALVQKTKEEKVKSRKAALNKKALNNK